eukprot:COSAG01_NODE_11270_length_1969_cov_0.985561_1_plen_250_part_00
MMRLRLRLLLLLLLLLLLPLLLAPAAVPPPGVATATARWTTPPHIKSHDVGAAAVFGDGAPTSVLVPGGNISATFAVSAAAVAGVGGTPSSRPLRYTTMAVYHEHDYHVAHFTATSVSQVSVTPLLPPAAAAITCAVRPRRLGIRAARSSPGASESGAHHSAAAAAVFTVPAPSSRPYYLMVECAGLDDKLVRACVGAPFVVCSRCCQTAAELRAGWCLSCPSGCAAGAHRRTCARAVYSRRRSPCVCP